MLGKFCLQPLQVHIKFRDWSPFSASNNPFVTREHRRQNSSSQMLHMIDSAFVAIVTSHFGHVLLFTRCLFEVLVLVTGVDVGNIVAIVVFVS